MKQQVFNCAVYTRKSSEEGLEQDFNSLDAQRESCLSYIASQKSEGWCAVKQRYEDGGYSGGNMNRPGLMKLMEDIKAGKVHIIVVYKIDRLTRSLMDFTKLVEVFDAHKVTFVSVTQSFNTTTSMGRLTLNVLLSFAQFEREVTGERIRDKVAASKKKGIWMGGSVPLGYQVKDRSLIVNANEAQTVKYIYNKYLELGCVRKLKAALDKEGVTSKTGNSFSRGMLYWLLQNPVYIGLTRHKSNTYAGQHKAIITEEQWNIVQQRLKVQGVSPRGQKKPLQYHLLQGLLFDEEGTTYSPVFTTKGNKRYRYYTSQNTIQYRNHPKGVIARIPAHEIESFVERSILAQFADARTLSEALGVDHDRHFEALGIITTKASCLQIDEILKTVVQKITISVDSVTIQIKSPGLRKLVQDKLDFSFPGAAGSETDKIIVPFQARKSWRGAVVIRPEKDGRQKDILDLPSPELRDLIRGAIWRDEHFKGMTIRQIAKRDGRSDVFVGRLIHNSFEIA